MTLELFNNFHIFIGEITGGKVVGHRCHDNGTASYIRRINPGDRYCGGCSTPVPEQVRMITRLLPPKQD